MFINTFYVFVLCVASIHNVNAISLLFGKDESRKPFKISCVAKPDQTEFKYFWIHEKFENSLRAQDLTYEFGKNSTFLFHFSGYGDNIIMDKPGELFYVGRGIVQENEDKRLVVCYCDYAYGNDGPVGRLGEYKNAIRHRVQFVVDLLSVFVKKLTELKIIESMGSITASGYCLGGHIAGMFGRMLNKKHKNKIRMVLAFDPPKYGFEKGKEMYTQRVQKGDANYVEITRSSTMGIETHDGDTNVILNNLKQPGCQFETITLMCNHLASYILHEIIFNNTIPAPFFASTDKNQRKNECLVGFYNTDYKPKGVVYLVTGEIFGTPEKTLFFELLDKLKRKMNMDTDADYY